LNAFSDPPVGVVSPSTIAFFVGNPPQQMQIFSGVAIVDFDSDGPTNHTTVEIILGYVRSRNIRYTAKADLASISNEDSEFIFAVDSVNVVNDERTGEIRLFVDLGVQGDKSTLLRFSYHVQVLSDFIDTLIAGTIRWRENLGSPSLGADAGQPIFDVFVGTYTTAPGGTPQPHWVISGTSRGLTVRAGGFWSVAYAVDNVPLGTAFSVVPSPRMGMLDNLPPGTIESAFAFVPAQAVTLTPAMPIALGIDFEMILPQGPR
jgi:hypothetical protein